jgi:hypothetical protein
MFTSVSRYTEDCNLPLGKHKTYKAIQTFFFLIWLQKRKLYTPYERAEEDIGKEGMVYASFS